MRQGGHGGDVELGHHGVGGGLDHDQAGGVGQGPAQPLLAPDEVHLVGALLDQDLQEAVGAAVEVLQGHDPAPVQGQRAYRELDGRHPRGQREGGAPAVQERQGVLEHVAGGAGGARVVVAGGLAQARVPVGGGQVDGGGDGAGGGVGAGARLRQDGLYGVPRPGGVPLPAGVVMDGCVACGVVRCCGGAGLVRGPTGAGGGAVGAW